MNLYVLIIKQNELIYKKNKKRMESKSNFNV